MSNADEALTAKALYIASLTSGKSATDWSNAQIVARAQIKRALHASHFLTDLAAGFLDTGSHMLCLSTVARSANKPGPILSDLPKLAVI